MSWQLGTPVINGGYDKLDAWGLLGFFEATPAGLLDRLIARREPIPRQQQLGSALG
jgi:hypothetical protein